MKHDKMLRAEGIKPDPPSAPKIWFLPLSQAFGAILYAISQSSRPQSFDRKNPSQLAAEKTLWEQPSLIAKERCPVSPFLWCPCLCADDFQKPLGGLPVNIPIPRRQITAKQLPRQRVQLNTVGSSDSDDP